MKLLLVCGLCIIAFIAAFTISRRQTRNAEHIDVLKALRLEQQETGEVIGHRNVCGGLDFVNVARKEINGDYGLSPDYANCHNPGLDEAFFRKNVSKPFRAMRFPSAATLPVLTNSGRLAFYVRKGSSFRLATGCGPKIEMDIVVIVVATGEKTTIENVCETFPYQDLGWYEVAGAAR